MVSQKQTLIITMEADTRAGKRTIRLLQVLLESALYRQLQRTSRNDCVTKSITIAIHIVSCTKHSERTVEIDKLYKIYYRREIKKK